MSTRRAWALVAVSATLTACLAHAPAVALVMTALALWAVAGLLRSAH